MSILDRFLLQWGHVFSDVEMVQRPGSAGVSSVLQWGHVFSDVEMSGDSGLPLAIGPASMGPRLFRRGNVRASS